MIKPAILPTLACLTISLSACHHPSGGFMPRTGGSQTYYSSEMMQKTITMIDLRTNEVFFGPLEVPPGKQLVIDFDAGDGDDPTMRPDLLYWEVMDQGKRFGKLHNAQSVPNAASRRIDVALKRGPEYANQSPQQRMLRTDEMDDRPAWWTPEGGPVPKDNRTTLYD